MCQVPGGVRGLKTPITFVLPIDLSQACRPAVDSHPLVLTCLAEYQAGLPESCRNLPDCRWYDHETSEWTNEGCRVVDPNVRLPNNTQVPDSLCPPMFGFVSIKLCLLGCVQGVKCECTHLTEFAILLREAESRNGLLCDE